MQQIREQKFWKLDLWKMATIFFLVVFAIFLVYPLLGLLKEAVFTSEGDFTLNEFAKFFSKPYYRQTIINSFSVSIAVTIVSLVIGIPFSYFYSFYSIKGSKLIYVLSIMCVMSAPFLGAYSWILLLGRSGSITIFFKNYLGINLKNIYGFSGILLVQSLKLFPLIFIYMNGAFKDIDSSLLEVSSSLGCRGINRFFKVILRLVMPTMLAAALLVFMRAFADFGTPLLIGEGYRTFPVEIYNNYLGEHGQNKNFAAAISIIAILVTALVFFIQKLATSKFNFTINSSNPIVKKKPKGIQGILMYIYLYGMMAISFLPQVYIIYLSFRNANQAVFLDGYSLGNYSLALDRLLGRSIKNTLIMGIGALLIIIIASVFIAYLVVRRNNFANNVIDTVSMIPYIIPGSVIGIALTLAFNSGYLVMTGTMTIMILSMAMRRMPYTIRSANASLMQVPMTTEEAAVSLGASKLKTFVRITVPMMSNGIISGAILSWVAIVTELSSAIILYNNSTITLTMSAYVAISRGNYGLAAAFSAILTVLTSLSLILYLHVSKTEDIEV